MTPSSVSNLTSRNQTSLFTHSVLWMLSGETDSETRLQQFDFVGDRILKGFCVIELEVELKRYKIFTDNLVHNLYLSKRLSGYFF